MYRVCLLMLISFIVCCFFFFNDTATTEIYTLSLHDALPICVSGSSGSPTRTRCASSVKRATTSRSEEHTSELQSLAYLVCRLLLEKKKNTNDLVLYTQSRVAYNESATRYICTMYRYNTIQCD